MIPDAFDPDEYNRKALAALEERGRKPTSVMIQVSAVCNLKCRMCGYVGVSQNKSLMAMDLYLQVLDDCRKSGIGTIYLVTAWGEPLVHPKIFEMIDAAADFQVRISTNATPLTDERIDRLARAKLDLLQISFAGYDKESYQSVYVGGRFEKVSENIRKLKAGLVRHGSPTRIWVNGVALRDDPEFVARTYAFLESLGLQRDEINVVLPSNYGGLYDPTNGEASGIKTLKVHRGRPVICSVLADNPGVLADGRVTACGCLDDAGALIIGKIGEQSLLEMRFGPRYQELLDKFNAGDISGIPLCADCDVPYGPTRLQKREVAEEMLVASVP